MEDFLFSMFKDIGGGKPDPNVLFGIFLRKMLIEMQDKVREFDGMLESILDNMPAGRGASTAAGTQFNPFDVLGVKPNATEQVVKEAYRKKAWEHHPDQGGDEKQMQMVNLAYEVICKFRGWSK